LVAGAGPGIGAETVMRLSEEGARLVVGDINIENARRAVADAKSAGGTAIALAYDQGDEDSIDHLVEQAVEELGVLDGVFASAAATSLANAEHDDTVVGLNTQVWEETFRVNLTGLAVLAGKSIPNMIEGGGGSIVFTSSLCAYMGEPVRAAYAASKVGIHALVRHIASRHGKEGIRVNAVVPGPVLTDAARANIGPEGLEQMLRDVRSTRLGEPRDIAAASAFLLSDDSSWVTGQALDVDGGLVLKP
jgi:NAD(P)-dependent dehydrogenase (short-subunit alcohol dehydrogenase family)